MHGIYVKLLPQLKTINHSSSISIEKQDMCIKPTTRLPRKNVIIYFDIQIIFIVNIYLQNQSLHTIFYLCIIFQSITSTHTYTIYNNSRMHKYLFISITREWHKVDLLEKRALIKNLATSYQPADVMQMLVGIIRKKFIMDYLVTPRTNLVKFS